MTAQEMPPPAVPDRSGQRADVRRTLPRFAVVGVISVGVDVVMLAALHSGLHVQLQVAVVTAFALSLVVNYVLNHTWAFRADSFTRARLAKYGVLIAINLAITLTVISALTSWGLYYLLAKVVAVAIGSTVNFVGYRSWVFT